MRNFLSIVALLSISFISLSMTACRKKDKGKCYCKYVSGDKKDFNLNSLPRNEQVDSCAVIDQNAESFGGSCKLE
ncbi:MAG: hypothetical protein V4635_06535 [Bacteroidota bacterium]